MTSLPLWRVGRRDDPLAFAPRWREQHVLAPIRLELDGPLVDLTDLATRQEVEQRHDELLIEHGLSHLDLHEITTGRRTVTQTIAAELYDRDVSAVRFPSRLDGQPCIALFEGRGDVHLASDPIGLTDPPPESLLTVTNAWGLKL